MSDLSAVQPAVSSPSPDRVSREPSVRPVVTAADHVRRQAKSREARLNAPRTISDLKHGTLGEIQRVDSADIGIEKKAPRWRAYGVDGEPLGLFKTSKLAINALCRDRNVPEWFA